MMVGEVGFESVFPAILGKLGSESSRFLRHPPFGMRRVPSNGASELVDKEALQRGYVGGIYAVSDPVHNVCVTHATAELGNHINLHVGRNAQRSSVEPFDFRRKVPTRIVRVVAKDKVAR